MSNNTILALDIGSSTIKAVIAGHSRDVESKITLLKTFNKPSKGIRRGVVVDMDEAAKEINSVLQSAKEVYRGAIKNIYLNIGGSDVKSQISKGIIAVSRASLEIHRDDIERVLEASEAVNLPSNRMIIHTINKEFIVDGVSVENPLGMNGARLEVISYIIDAFKPNVKNTMKCIALAGGGVSALIFNPLASALSVLSRNQKELGVLLVDIGFGTTGIAVYEEGKLLHTKIIPVGAGHITNDLAIALKIPVDVAETIKISYGYAISSDVGSRDHIELQKIDSTLKGNPSKKYIAQIIESRLSEICDLINAELKSIEKDKRLPGGVIIVGGGAKLPGIAELFKSELKLTAKIGLPSSSSFEANNTDAGEFMESPEYAGVLGLASWGLSLHPREQRLFNGTVSNIASKTIGYLKNFLP